MKKKLLISILSLTLCISSGAANISAAYAEPKYNTETTELQSVNMTADVPKGFPYTLYVLYQKDNETNINGVIILNKDNNFSTSDEIPVDAKIKDIKVVGSTNNDIKNYSTVYSGNLDNLKINVLRTDGKDEPIVEENYDSEVEEENQSQVVEDQEEKELNKKLEELDKADTDDEINAILENKKDKSNPFKNIVVDVVIVISLGVILLLIKNKKNKGEM